MILRIKHRTAYEYGGPITQSLNEARLRPVSDETQRCLEYNLSIVPQSGVVREYHDFYGNHVQYFELHHSHTSLVVESVAVVETLLNNPFNFTEPVALDAYETEGGFEEYLLESKYVPLTPELWRFAMDIRGNHQDVWALAVGMMQYIHQNFKYERGSTNVHTSASETLTQRTGVCQDYTHVLLGALRSLKIPARYVSGYIYENLGVAGLHAPGDMASHAWAEIFLPKVGWRGLDSTNGMVVNHRYVKLAVGRDYADATPLRGAYRGPPTRDLQVNVGIEELTGHATSTMRG